MEHLKSFGRHFTHITKNAAKCLNCGDEVESKHRHDFQSCRCGAISVDGGKDYIRRIGDFSVLHELIETSKYTLQELIDQKKRTMKEMRSMTYSASFYNSMIEAAEYYAQEWYGCKI